MSGLNRNTIDKFYTDDKTVQKIYKYIKKYLIIKNNELIIEPSAGNGSFIPIIKKLSDNYVFLDIQPEHCEIQQQDYLTYINNINMKTHVIGNPPFGRQSSLAIKFIKKSTEFANSISFILPKSFKKDSLRKHFNIYFHLLFETDIDDDFLLNGKYHNVPCIFQIWEKRDYKREIPIKLEPYKYLFVKKNENPSISFRRVGVYAGKIDTDIDKSEQSHYFIKFDCPNIDYSDFHYKYDDNNTVGPKSISKQQIIKVFNNIVKSKYNH